MRATVKRRRAVLLLQLLPLMLSCIRGEGLTLPRDASQVPPDQLQTLLQESSSGIDSRRRGVIRGEAEWSAFWDEVHSRRSPVPERPDVDFEQSMVIVASMGTRPTGGYEITFDAVGRTGADYHVVVRESAPGRSCGTTAALTQPVTAVRVARSDGNVSFIERTSTLRC